MALLTFNKIVIIASVLIWRKVLFNCAGNTHVKDKFLEIRIKF